VASLATEVIAYGSDTVLVADSPLLAEYRTETFTKVLADLINDKKPEAVLLGATARGRDVAPRLAARLNTGHLADCIALDIDAGARVLLGTRETHKGLLLATTACASARPQIATVRAGCLRAAAGDRTREGAVESVAVGLSEADLMTEITPGAIARQPLSLQDSPVIVAGGRGIGGGEGFAVLQELASVLGGTVAASRSAVEQGWASPQQMVDITGIQVRPDLYVAVSIAGTFPQRIATRGTKCLVAINRDPNAPIFKRCDYGIVGDWRAIVPELVRAIREVKER
jgi:electron transfer flavoprotein alpha subunit